MVIEEILELYSKNEMRKLKQICYPMLIKIGGISECDYDDFYSIANRTLWLAAKSFDESKHDNFEIFLKGCIARKFKTELTDRNRKRRIKSSHIDSLDRPMSEDSNVLFGEILDSGFSIENEIEDFRNDNVDRYLDSLSPKQRKIAELIVSGYTVPDIKVMLNIDDARMSLCLDKMRSFEKRIILQSR